MRAMTRGMARQAVLAAAVLGAASCAGRPPGEPMPPPQAAAEAPAPTPQTGAPIPLTPPPAAAAARAAPPPPSTATPPAATAAGPAASPPPMAAAVPPPGPQAAVPPPGADVCWHRERRDASGWTPWNRAYLSTGRSIDARL